MECQELSESALDVGATLADVVVQAIEMRAQLFEKLLFLYQGQS